MFSATAALLTSTYPGAEYLHPTIHFTPDYVSNVGGWHDVAGALTALRNALGDGRRVLIARLTSLAQLIASAAAAAPLAHASGVSAMRGRSGRLHDSAARRRASVPVTLSAAERRLLTPGALASLSLTTERQGNEREWMRLEQWNEQTMPVLACPTNKEADDFKVVRWCCVHRNFTTHAECA